MEPAALIWIIIYCCAALLFFGTALYIGIAGGGDLKDLLSKSVRSGKGKSGGTPAGPPVVEKGKE